MTDKRRRAVKARMRDTGEPYNVARRHISVPDHPPGALMNADYAHLQHLYERMVEKRRRLDGNVDAALAYVSGVGADVLTTQWDFSPSMAETEFRKIMRSVEWRYYMEESLPSRDSA